MATGSLYGSVSESTGLYGIGAASGGTYFEWFIFQDSATAPATPTGGSWSFTNNTGTAPTGWVVSPPPAPVNQVWVSIAVVDSRNATTFTWSVPGLMTGSGLPILTGAGVPSSGTGLNGQLYINTSTTPQSLYNKQTGAWVQLSGSNLVDLVNNQTIGGVKTFSQTIQGSISGNAGNVSGTVAVVNGGTGATTASDARTNLGLGTIATQAASNVAITGGSITGITDLAVADGGTGASTAANARTNLGAVGLTDTQTLTNKSISGSANTLTNIPNSALVYDSVNINSVDFTLGAVQTIGADWILPSYAGNAGKVLALNTSASDVEWVPAAGVGTVTSVAVSGGTTGLTSSGGPITAAGTITLGGTLSLLNGGTGQTTANAAFNALVPLQTGNSGKYLTTNGTDTSWAANPLGTVTSVSGTGTVSGLTLTGTVTTSGNLTLGGTLNLSAPPAIGGTTPNTGVFTNLTVNDNTILGSSNSDTVNFNARVNSDIDPSTDNTYDLGRNAHAWRNLYLTGTANIAALTASGAVTFSGGTANGVAYLNGSKVLTTGSALTFDGSVFEVAPATGVVAKTKQLVLNNFTGEGVGITFSRTTDATEVNAIGTANNSWDMGIFARENMIFATGGASTYSATTERMRLDPSGNVGIGTSSPAVPLEVSNASSGIMRITTVSGASQLQFKSSGTNLQYISYNIGGAGALSFYDSNVAAERMRLDSSGNLGLGVTPSAWVPSGAGGPILQIQNAAFFGSASTTGVLNNAYYNGGFKYISSDYASWYEQIDSKHVWYTAPSGTAGDAITFSQAMTLDASGNLLVGNTSQILFTNKELNVNAASGSAGLALATAGVARLYMTGTSTEGNITTKGAIPLLFGTNETERARITSGGNLLIGTTSELIGTSRKLSVDATLNAAVFKGSTAASEVVNVWSSATSGDNVFIEFDTETSVTARGSITYNRAGGLVAYNVTSDYRAKDIYGPVTDSGALIDSVPVYMGKMKGATQERPMFIAHEVPAYAHTGEKDAVDADGKPVYQQMDASALIPVMWAEIQSLRQRLAAAGI